jgi:hypothetical protein
MLYEKRVYWEIPSRFLVMTNGSAQPRISGFHDTPSGALRVHFGNLSATRERVIKTPTPMP